MGFVVNYPPATNVTVTEDGTQVVVVPGDAAAVQADNAKDAALAAQAAAESSASAAQTAENDAGVSALLAQDWAVKLVDPVSGGEYSAKYYAQEAESFYDQFDDAFLGAKATDPTLDNDGDPLVAGQLYYNDSSDALRIYTGSVWRNAISDTPTGGSTDQVFYENDATVTTDYAITASRNAVTAGPLTINSGVTVTVPVGSAWTIV